MSAPVEGTRAHTTSREMSVDAKVKGLGRSNREKGIASHRVARHRFPTRRSADQSPARVFPIFISRNSKAPSTGTSMLVPCRPLPHCRYVHATRSPLACWSDAIRASLTSKAAALHIQEDDDEKERSGVPSHLPEIDAPGRRCSPCRGISKCEPFFFFLVVGRAFAFFLPRCSSPSRPKTRKGLSSQPYFLRSEAILEHYLP